MKIDIKLVLRLMLLEILLWPLKRPVLPESTNRGLNFLSTLSTDPPGELDVLGHDGDPLGVNGAQVGVLKETNQVSLRGLLESHDSRGLETQVSLEVLSDLTDETLEGELADQELSGFLVTPDLTKSHCTGTVPVGLLDSASGWGALTGSLGSQLFAGSLSSGGFTSGLLGTGHCDVKSVMLQIYERVLFIYLRLHAQMAQVEFYASFTSK